MNAKRTAATLVVVAALGLFVFGLLAWQAVSVQEMDAPAALEQFEMVRAALKGEPLVRRDDSGRFERRVAAAGDAPASQLHVLAYHASGRQMIRADLPLWFLKTKGPAAQYALRGTAFNLAALNLTPTELETAGACVVIDEVRPNGDRLVAWTN